MKGMTRNIALWIGKWHYGAFMSKDGSRKGVKKSDVDAVRKMFAASEYADGSLYSKHLYRGMTVPGMDSGKVRELIGGKSRLRMNRTVAESWTKDPRIAYKYMFLPKFSDGAVLLKRKMHAGSVIVDLSERLLSDLAGWWPDHFSKKGKGRKYMMFVGHKKAADEVVAKQQCLECGIEDVRAVKWRAGADFGSLDEWREMLSLSGYAPNVDTSDPEEGHAVLLVLSGRKAYLRTLRIHDEYRQLRKFGLA